MANDSIYKITDPLRSKLKGLRYSMADSQYFNTFIGFNVVPGPDEYNLVYNLGGYNIEIFKNLNVIKAALTSESIKQLALDPRVIYIEEIGIIKSADVGIPNVDNPKKEAYGLASTYPWGFDKIRTSNIHASGNRGKGVKVCVIDTGIDYTHEDLSTAYKGGYNFVNNNSYPKDDYYHGTHVCGIIAGQGKVSPKGITVLGVAPECSLYAVKVLDSNGSGSVDNILRALQWTIDNGMHIINMSFGGGRGNITYENAMNNAYNSGITCIAAAGNNGIGSDCNNLNRSTPCPIPNCNIDNLCDPAPFKNVIAVSATDSTDLLSCFSSRGPNVAVAAPGEEIYSTFPTYIPINGCTVNPNNTGCGYAYASGTSMACPHTAGLAALIKASNMNYSPSQIRQCLINGSIELGASGRDWCYGYGRIDAPNAISCSGSTPPPPSGCTKIPRCNLIIT